MSFDEITDYLDAMQQKEKEKFKYDLTMLLYNAAFINSKKPYEMYQKIVGHVEKRVMSDKEMEQAGRNIAIMFGGTIKKGGD